MSPVRFGGAVGIAFGLLLLAAAPAEAQRHSRVTLIDGSVVHGEVVTYDPGVRVVMRMSDGSTREIPAEQIQSADFELLPMPSARPSAWLGDPEAGVDEAERPPERARRPVRFGAQLTVGGELYDHSFIGPAPYGDFGLVLEIRPVWRFHVRGTFSVWSDFRGDTLVYNRAMPPEMVAVFHPGLVGARGRLLFGLDLFYRIGVRVGAELGFVLFSIVGQGDVVMPTGGGIIEIGWRAILGFEIAVVIGIVTRPGRYEEGLPTPNAIDHSPVGARLGLHLEYLF